MRDQSLIVREPILNLNHQVVGYELSWLKKITEPDGVTEFNALLEFVCNQCVDPEYGWLLSNDLLFLEITPELLSTPALKLLPPKNIVLTIDQSHFATEINLASLFKMSMQGYGVCLRGANVHQLNYSILKLISHFEVHFDAHRVEAKDVDINMFSVLKQAAICILTRHVNSRRCLEACVEWGTDIYTGECYLNLHPKSGEQARGINALQSSIVQLMRLTKQNADFTSLELIFRETPVLVGQLLDYIKVTRFGLRPSLFALAHAVQLHGYGALYRWLAVLFLVNADSYSAALMETVLVRGRFAELLGIDNLSTIDAENLFVVGVFSLADRMLRMPMQQLLFEASLPEFVQQALLHREGRYAYYLSLIEGCELPVVTTSPGIEVKHEVPIADINQIHVSALIWAKTMMVAIGKIDR